METAFFLMAQYGQPVIPVDRLVKDYFSHLTLRSFLRKVDEGNLPIPLVRMEDSQKATKGVHIKDLAKYLDDQRAKGLRTFNQVYSQATHGR